MGELYGLLGGLRYNNQQQLQGIQNALGSQSLANALELQNQQFSSAYLPILGDYRYYPTYVEEDILSPAYIRKEWDQEFCKAMFWTPREFQMAMDKIKNEPLD